jgi:PPOX class probable F420-dependent enzyme
MSEFPTGFEDLLNRPLIGHLATVRPDGNPSVTPMWYAWDGELLRFSHTTRRAKLRNIGYNPYVALSVNDPEEPHRYLQTRAVVVSVDPDLDGGFYRELQQRYGWPGTQPLATTDRVVIAARPMAYSTQDVRSAT